MDLVVRDNAPGTFFCVNENLLLLEFMFSNFLSSYWGLQKLLLNLLHREFSWEFFILQFHYLLPLLPLCILSSVPIIPYHSMPQEPPLNSSQCHSHPGESCHPNHRLIEFLQSLHPWLILWSHWWMPWESSSPCHSHTRINVILLSLHNVFSVSFSVAEIAWAKVLLK